MNRKARHYIKTSHRSHLYVGEHKIEYRDRKILFFLPAIFLFTSFFSYFDI